MSYIMIYDLKTVPTLIDIGIGFDIPEQNVTEGTNSTVEVCFSSQQDSLKSSSVTLIVDISPTVIGTSGKSNIRSMLTRVNSDLCTSPVDGRLPTLS